MRLKFFFSMLAAAAIALTGCNKQTELEINYGKSGTVQGKVTIFKDNGTSEIAAGIKVYAKIPYSELITTVGEPEDPADGNESDDVKSELQGYKTFEAKTDQNGIYKFEIPVVDNADNDIELYTENKEIDGKFYYGTASANRPLTPNSTVFQNIDMLSKEMSEAVKTINGTVKIQGAGVASGFTVEAKYTVEPDTYTFTTTTNSDGKYTFQLPEEWNNSSIKISVPEQTVGDKVYEQTNPSNPSINDGKVADITVTEKQ